MYLSGTFLRDVLCSPPFVLGCGECGRPAVARVNDVHVLLDCSIDLFWLIGFLVWFVLGPGASGWAPKSPKPRRVALGGLRGPPEPPGPGSTT